MASLASAVPEQVQGVSPLGVRMWRLRRLFWNFLAVIKFRANRPAHIPVPTDSDRAIRVVSLAERFPQIPIRNIRVADHVPTDEASPLNHAFYDLQVALYRLFPPMQSGLPPIAADPRRALEEAYTRAHRACRPMPVLPPEYQGSIDLGYLAVAGPYAAYIAAAAGGTFVWDLRQQAQYEHHAGLRSLGTRVVFRLDKPTRRLRAVEIECELGVCKPRDPDWELAQRLALCTVTTHVSLVRHFNWVHLAAGGPLAIATRNCLGADHPLRRLLWPHIFGTQYSNELVTKGQMSPGGDFESIFSFTHRGMCRLFEDTYEQYDIGVLDPPCDAQRRGIAEAGFENPAVQERRAYFDLLQTHASAYLSLYYRDDEELQRDSAVAMWIEALEALVPNGVRTLMGAELTLATLSRLVAAFIYMATVEHEILGSALWNYQMWTHVQPVRVYKSGQREPLDIYQRLVNANFNLNVHRAPLLQDFSSLALDGRGAEAFRRFKQALDGLEQREAAEPFAYWRIYPHILKANINA
jgi:Lipoxygenase